MSINYILERLAQEPDADEATDLRELADAEKEAANAALDALNNRRFDLLLTPDSEDELDALEVATADALRRIERIAAIAAVLDGGTDGYGDTPADAYTVH